MPHRIRQIARPLPFLLLTLIAGGCSTLFQAPAAPVPSGFLLGPAPVDRNLCYSGAKTKIRVEIDHLAGWAPGEKALAGLRKLLEHYCLKPDGIEIVVDEEIAVDPWEGTAEQIRGLVERHRTPVTDPKTASIYILYCPFETETPKLRGYCRPSTEWWPGTDFTLITFYTDRVRSLGVLWLTARKIERTVLIHETGHALGLVRRPDHRWPDDNPHCTDPTCVMYKQVDGRVLAANALPAVFLGQIPDDFCGRCEHDLSLGRDPPAIYASRLITEYHILPKLSAELANALTPEAKAEIRKAAADSDPEVRALAEKLQGMME